MNRYAIRDSNSIIFIVSTLVQMYRKISGLANVKVFHVMGKALSSQPPCRKVMLPPFSTLKGKKIAVLEVNAFL